MKETFKIRLTNEPKDEHLKMNLLYHLPVARLIEVIEYLEKIAPRKVKHSLYERNKTSNT